MEDDVGYTATQISTLGIAEISSASKATTILKELVGEGKVINQKVRGVNVYRKV